MPGKEIELLKRTEYNFTVLAAAAQLAPIFVAEEIPIAEYREQTVQIRLHEKAATSGWSFNVQVWQELPSTEDPGKTFRSTAAFATVNVPSTQAAPGLVSLAVPANAGGMISIAIAPIQANPAVTFTFTISIALSLKS